MGLPGSGKTYLAKRLSYLLNADWFNADKIRQKNEIKAISFPNNCVL